jgi:hypothetical protein
MILKASPDRILGLHVIFYLLKFFTCYLHIPNSHLEVSQMESVGDQIDGPIIDDEDSVPEEDVHNMI